MPKLPRRGPVVSHGTLKGNTLHIGFIRPGRERGWLPNAVPYKSSSQLPSSSLPESPNGGSGGPQKGRSAS